MMDWKGIMMQYIKECRPSAIVQYEHIYYREIQKWKIKKMENITI